jgi:hypothetical protein
MVDYLAVLVATLAAFAVGAVWYSVLFQRSWKELMGFSDEAMRTMKMTPALAMTGGFVTTLILVYALASLMDVLPISTALEAAWFGLMISVGFIATTQANIIWYENKPLKLFFINASHYIVAVIAAALVLFYWP